MALTQYLYITILGGIFGFLYAFGIGANDVANAFGSTVASKSLTLKQAVIAAGIFEFLGALLLGASVTSTIRSKIFDPDLYEDEPEIVLLGMFTALMTGSVMLLVATSFALPVSTTHTIVGAIMGFSIVAKGFQSIEGEVVINIIISWVISPVVSGFLAFCFFGCVRYFVMRHEDPYHRAFYTFPIVLTIGVGIDLFYILYKGLSNTAVSESFRLEVIIPVSFAVGFVCGLIWIFLVGPWANKRVEKKMAERNLMASGKGKSTRTKSIVVDLDEAMDKSMAASKRALEVGGDEEALDTTEKLERDSEETPEEDEEDEEDVEEPQEEKKEKGFFGRASARFAENTYGQDLHEQSMHESQRASELWDTSEQFDPNAEQLFTYIQVFTACLNSFAHGANDVANAIAPISAIIYIYQTGELSSKSPVQKWILAYGGVGLVVGLLIYGYKVMKSIGYKLCMLSPSRGASAELAASLFVVTASFLGIPVSSTQCIVGAVAGVGLVGGWKNIQWLFLLRVACGWVGVFGTSILLSAGLFAAFAYSPTLAPAPEDV